MIQWWYHSATERMKTKKWEVVEGTPLLPLFATITKVGSLNKFYRSAKLNKEISKIILQRLNSVEFGCASWMHDMFLPKEFWCIKKSGYHKLKSSEVYKLLQQAFNTLCIELNKNDYYNLLRIYNKLGILIIACGLGLLRTSLKPKKNAWADLPRYSLY